ncbi:MAG: mannose-1-phosphate guanylyltransferase/mannose-6-phosphate isomerase [Rickettsiales bacterium]|nr:mannose-1-phosphate guanylyltransferase/mannose-6-phosphate isomerase [Rickettsiales bacterium]
MKITPVILSGGTGTRLWPVSRKLDPKQFSDFFGDKSLFQQTILRTQNNKTFHTPITICNNEHRFSVSESLKNINITPKSIILEPSGRNTAPAIAIAAIDIITHNEKNDDLMLVMPSDHIIENETIFLKQVEIAATVAKKEHLVTFGIVPKSPETGYGYIKKSTKIKGLKEAYHVDKFVEKPDVKTAEKFIKDNGYFWNSGIFLFKASTYLEELQKHNNPIFLDCCNSYNNATKDLEFTRLDKEYFDKCDNISIDYCIMEKTKKAAIVPLDAKWSDVGSWDSIHKISDKDKNNNSLIGDVKALNTQNCYIHSSDKLITTIGVKDLIIISLRDAVLVANKNSSQDVKTLFNILKEEKREECIQHTKTHRPWGSFETIYLTGRSKVKKITVNPQSCLSLQMHNHRAEHWIVIKGTAYVTCDDKEFILTEDQSTYIPIGEKHRLENKGKIPLEVIEVQTGSYLGEDDIIRFSDMYGR